MNLRPTGSGPGTLARLSYSLIGSDGGIRTHTAHALNVLPPAKLGYTAMLHRAVFYHTFKLKVVVLVESVPFNPLMFTRFIHDSSPIVLPSINLGNEMPVYDIIEDFPAGETFAENQREEVAVSIKPMAIVRKPAMYEIKNHVIVFHTSNYTNGSGEGTRTHTPRSLKPLPPAKLGYATSLKW